MKIADFSIKHPAIVIIVSAMIIVFGLISLFSLNQEFIPDINMPSVMVLTLYPGVGAEDVAKEVTDVLEDRFSSLSGLGNLSSTSSDSMSFINLEFKGDTNLDLVFPEIRALIDQAKKDLPSGIEGEPSAFLAGSTLLPIFSFSIESDIEDDTLFNFVEDELTPSIAKLPGVSDVRSYGGQRKEVKISLKIEEMESRGIAALDVLNQLQYFNVSMPAGNTTLRKKSINMRTVGDFSSLQEIEDLVIGSRENSFIYLKDVADISIDYPDPEIYIRAEGENLFVVDVLKRSDGNTIEICDAIVTYLEDTQKQYGDVVNFKILQNDSQTVSRSLFSVVKSAVMGVAMAVLVILFFLHNIRATIIIGVSIPLSIVMAFIGMKFAGQTVNFLSLSGLTVALGMIVDSSIVVLENVHNKLKINGDRMLSASQGTHEVGSAIIASTSTSISVFAPMIALTGIMGIILRDISYTMVFSLLASMITALIVVPFLSSKILNGNAPPEKSFLGKISRLIEKAMGVLRRAYKRVLSAALDNRGYVIFVAVVILIVSVMTMGLMGISFLPSSDSGEFFVSVKTPQDYSLEQTLVKMEHIESIIREITPEIETAVFFTGYVGETSKSSPSRNKGYGKIILSNSTERERGIGEIMSTILDTVRSQVPGVEFVCLNGGLDNLLSLASGGQGYSLKLSGANSDDLRRTALEIKRLLDQDPEVAKTEINVDFNKEELIADLSLEYLGSLGISSYEAAATSRIMFTGMDAGKMRSSSGDYDIILTSELNGQPVTRDTIEQITVISQGGDIVSFGSFTELIAEPSVSSVHHDNRIQTITITAYLTGLLSDGVDSRLKASLEEINIPFGITWSVGGTMGLLGDSLPQLVGILLLAIFLVYSVMVIQFEKFIQPLIVLASIPFCVIGVVAGLLAFGSTFSLVAFLGVIALFGIVVNNAIVLIDYINMLRKEKGVALKEAIIIGGVSRIQPILMTTLTTVLGVMPLALGSGNGAEVYAPLGQAIAGGLVTSTLITLVIIPVLYHVVESRAEARGESTGENINRLRAPGLLKKAKLARFNHD